MRAPAKINIFLKIVGTRGDYHELLSRFVRYDELCDELEFVEGEFAGFTILGMEIPQEANIIHKAYKQLLSAYPSIAPFFKRHAVRIHKRIPQGAGLGGGSSDAAAFLLMAKETLGLAMKEDELMRLGASIGADVPFFLSGYEAANVSGIGEVIEPFEDDIPSLKLKLLPIHCDTAEVYRNWRRNHLRFDPHTARKLTAMKSSEILATIAPQKANDLYSSALELCDGLRGFEEEWFLSGSGSTLFRREE